MEARFAQIRQGWVVVAGIALAVLQGLLLSVFDLQFLQFVAGALLSLIVMMFCLARPASLLVFIIGCCAFVGLGRDIQPITVGRVAISFWGLLWALIFGMLCLLLFLNFRRVKVPAYLWPFFAFSTWVALRWALGNHSLLGLKDVLFFGLPVMIGLFAAFVLGLRGKFSSETLLVLFFASGAIPLLMYGILIPAGAVEFAVHGPTGIIGPRPTALYLLILMCPALALNRYGDTARERFWGLMLSLVALGMAVFTISRTTFAVAVALLLLSRIQPDRHVRLVLGAVLAGLLAIAATVAIPAFRARFFYRTPKTIQEAVFYLNTTGRGFMWPLTFENAMRHPVVGWGPGEARRMLGGTLEDEHGEVHPHNEYLQVFHDSGLIGLGLFLYAWFMLLFRNWRGWTQAMAEGNSRYAVWSMSTVLAILAMMAYGIVGNSFHYVFVIGPLFIFAACADDEFRNSLESPRSTGPVVPGRA